jgi:hypothetical protein
VKLPLPSDLEAALLKGLAKRPADRFATAQEFADALAACESAREWTVRQAGQWWTAHLAGATATQAVVVTPSAATASVDQLPTMEMAK